MDRIAVSIRLGNIDAGHFSRISEVICAGKESDEENKGMQNDLLLHFFCSIQFENIENPSFQ
jgi:hypothetical protein